MLDILFSTPRGVLSPQKTLDLANAYLAHARNTEDREFALAFCHDVEATLSRIEKAVRKADASQSAADQALRHGIAAAYLENGKILESWGCSDKAQASSKKAEKWRYSRPTKGPFPPASSAAQGPGCDSAQVPRHIFPDDMPRPAVEHKLPEAEERLTDTPQLAYCLGLLQTTPSPDEAFEPTAGDWLKATKENAEEQERLKTLATDLIRIFHCDKRKSAESVSEVVCVASVLGEDDFRYLLEQFVNGIEHSSLLDFHSLEGLAQLMQSASPGFLKHADLVTILGLLNTRLQATHKQSPDHIYQLLLTISHVLDAMTDIKVVDLKRVELHKPLSAYLKGLQDEADSHVIYQATYAFQALQRVPDNESPWQATARRAGIVLKVTSGLISAVKGLDVNDFLKELGNLQEVLEKSYQAAKIGYEGVTSRINSGKDLLDSLKGGFTQKRAWYTALRGIDTLLRDRQLAKVEVLVYEAPCRHELAFQWGVCQRLGDLAANPLWSPDFRQGAVAFLGEIYRNDPVWGEQAQVKQFILNILMQLDASSDNAFCAATNLLQELETDGNETKQALYRDCRKEGPSSHPFKVALPPIASPSLLDRVQDKPDVEADLRRLRQQRLKMQGDAVYIPPQAKASLQDRDDARFPLMDKVEKFLSSTQKVLLLLGDSGVGKSTFNRQLECDLWHAYKPKEGQIPLFISLPAIQRPEQDLIAKQLRKAEFTESQIHELKAQRDFIVICDGYDESQQTNNLYMSNQLNQSGGWKAQVVISCRSEYLGVDYRDRFQPGDRNNLAESEQFQEAVVVPFSKLQVQEYIQGYVTIKAPLWQATHYLEVLEQIPSLLELVKNPFILTLSLEVLPRMVDPGQNLATAKITRVALYDQFVEQWLERGKKRLSAKDMSSQEKKAFESLSDEGFTRNGIAFLKGLAAAIYEKQGGNPVVEYSRTQDQGTWKEDFFSRDEEKQLLREACPLIRSGNQFRFIHRSLLEYSLARAVFEPQEGEKNTRKTTAPTSEARRCSVGSAFSFELQGALGQKSAIAEQGPDIDSPLVRRNYVSEPSILEFLEERVQQEPVFKQQLLAFIEHSKTDRKWRVAAANAITILVRAGFQFNGADLQGIQIPGADLSHGVFDSAQLQGADLRKVNLRNVWFRQANLSDARMTGVQFDELPYLEEDGEILSCAYSPDGNTYAVGLKDGQINVYSTTTWEKTRTLVCHGGGFGTIVYSPKGDLIVAVDNYRDLRLWEVETGACCHVLSGHSEWIVSVAYSPSGGQIASGGNDKTVRLWDSKTGACSRLLNGHSHMVRSVVYSPKGDLIASGSRDKTVRLWDVETGDCRHVLRGHSERVLSVAYSPSGDQIASGSVDATVRLWDVETGVCQHILSGHSGTVQSVMYSPNGGQIASVSDDKTVRLWDVQTGEFHQTLSDNGSKIQSIAYSPAGDQIASGSDDSTLQIWDVATGVCRRSLRVHSGPIQSVVFSPKGNQIACGSNDRRVRLWEVESGTSRNYSIGHNEQVLSVIKSPNGDWIASASADKTVRLWDTEIGTCRHILRGHTNSVLSVAFSPKGDQIASGSGDRTVRLWDVETGDCHILTGHSDKVASVAYSPEGDQIVTGGLDCTVCLWDVKSRTGCLKFSGHSDHVLRVAYSPKADQVASGSKDKTVRLWDLATGTCCHILQGHKGPVRDVAYSPRSDLIVSASDDSTLRLWDTKTGACRHVLSGHSGEVVTVMYYLKGDQVASGSDDRTVRLWDVASGKCRAVIQGFYSNIYSITWKPTSVGHYVVTGSYDKLARVWEVTEDEGQHNVHLRWSSSHDRLTMTDTSLHDVHGLSSRNKRLLEQLGTVGEPTPPMNFQEAGATLMNVKSFTSKLKLASNKRLLDPSPVVIGSTGQPSMAVESANPP